MTRRPKIAVKVAQYIAEWSETETLLGLFLALLLHANQKAILAIYGALENRAAQLRMIASAAEASLPRAHADVITVLLKADIRPSMKYRDKLAHWCWGWSEDLPDALLIRDPADKLANLSDYVNRQHLSWKLSGTAADDKIEMDQNRLYVVTEPDLDRAIKRLGEAQLRLRTAQGSVWEANEPSMRASLLRQLAETPLFRTELERLAANRKNQKAPPQAPGPGPNGGS